MITLYTQPLCRPCERIKNKLREAGLEFEEVDIIKDEKAYSFVKYTIGAKSTPVIVGPDGLVAIGYDASKEAISALGV